MTDVVNVSVVPLHLGLGSTVRPVPDFAWTPEALAAYDRRFASDGAEGRLMIAFDSDVGRWPTWEVHPAGDEIVLLLSGRADLVQWIDGEEQVSTLGPLDAVVNPAGVWHTARVHERGVMLTVTAGLGTRHCPVEDFPPAEA